MSVAFKTLTIVSRGLDRSDTKKLKILEESDQHPRVTFFAEALNSVELDEKFLGGAPAWRRVFYKVMPTTLAQVVEAFFIKKNYDAVISWAEKLGLPLALLMKITHSSVPHVALFGWPAIGTKATLLKYTHSEIDRIILWSTVQRQKVVNDLKVPPSRISFIKWPVDERFFRPFPTNTDLICAVGSEMRDYPTLIEAMRGLTIRCHIAAGSLIEKNTSWERAIDEEVSLPENISIGRKSLLELRDLYARSRFVVVPLHQTDTDNGITNILESFAMGKPVICSRTAGQVDVIEEGVTGIFVPVGNSAALRDAIVHLWNSPDEVTRMGKAARSYIEQHATLDGFCRDVRKAVEEAIREHKKN